MIIEKIPFLLISLIFGIVAVHTQENALQDMAPKMSSAEHILIVSYSFVSYLFKAIIPIHLSAIYPYPVVSGNTLPLMYYISVVCMGLILFSLYYSYRWGKDFLFGFLFFTITIILVLQIVPVGAAAMADRYTYIPYIGVFFVIGKFCEHLILQVDATSIKYKKYLFTLLTLGFLIFSKITYARVGVWENDETLFSDVINKYPDCSVPYQNRAYFYLKHYANNVYVNNKVLRDKYIKNAINDFETSLKLPTSLYNKVKVYYTLGTARDYLGDYSGAITNFDEAIRLDARYISAYNNRGCERNKLKNWQGAIEDFNKVIELNPKDAIAYTNRGNTKYEMKDYTGAITDFDEAINIDTNYAYAYYYRASVKNEVKDYSGAIKDFDKVIKIEPDNATAFSIRGYAKHMSGDYKGALDDYNSAIKLNPLDVNAIGNRNIIMSILKKEKI